MELNNEKIKENENENYNNIDQNLGSKDKPDAIKLYFRRWIILIIFSILSMLNALNWIVFNTIQDITISFYNESLPGDDASKNDAVNWFSMVYQIAYIPLVFPAMFLLDRKGLKLSITIGALLNAIGSIIKLAAVRSDLFAVAMLGQIFCAIAQAFILGVPSRLASIWFGSREIATATSIAVLGNQLGDAVAFLFAPFIVNQNESLEVTKMQFYVLIGTVAFACTFILILVLMFVKDQPEIPANLAQYEIRKYQSKEKNSLKNDLKIFKTSLINLSKNRNFVLVFFSYGIIVGTYYSISTLLNQMISEQYPNENKTIGLIGFIFMMSGIPGSLTAGLILDKTKKFKFVSFIYYTSSFAALILFISTLYTSIWIIFGTAFLLGFFIIGYLPLGFELAAELTYPEPEGTSSGLLNTSVQIFASIFILMQGRITKSYGILSGNIFICAFFLIGNILAFLIKSDYRRENSTNTFKNKKQNLSEILPF